jgi:hypothetical protein
MAFNIKSNTFTKTIAPKVALEFDTDAERIAFVDYLDKIEYDGLKFAAVRGVVDVVKVKNYVRGLPADPVTAIATATGELLKLTNNVVGLFVDARNRKDRRERIDLELSALDPLVDKLFANYPFLRSFYESRRIGLVDAINNARGKKKDPFFEQLNGLLKSVIASIQPVLPSMQRIQLTNDPPFVVTNFEREFLDFFAKNPHLLPQSTTPKTDNINTNTNSGNSAGTSKSNSTGILIPSLIVGGILLASQNSKKVKNKKKS